MNIGIYNEPSGLQLGGSEYMLAVLADALSARHTVEVLQHNPALTRDRLSQFSDMPLEQVRVRLVQRHPGTEGDSRWPWLRYAEARAWRRELSAPYDVFINCTHGKPPFCAAPIGVLLVLFPFYRPTHLAEHESSSDLSAFIRRAYHRWEWRRRFAGYAVRVSISEYTRLWTREWWGIDSQVIHPPVDVHFDGVKKTERILSVGRFSAGAHGKHQLEMTRLFAELAPEQLAGWDYVTVGGASAAPEDVAYVAGVRHAAGAAPVAVRCNVPRHELRGEYGKAAIFWHAPGYGDPVDSPQLAEHFGISTVEAMAAGCVPIVVNRGGQREIVEHGVTGFLWDTLDELKTFTLMVAKDEELRTRISHAARKRAQDFARERFVARFLSVVERAVEHGARRAKRGHRRP